MKKKIIFVSEALWIGGIETALLNLLNRMDYDKYDVTLLLRWAIFDSGMRQKIPPRCRVRTFDRNDGQYPFIRLYRLTEKADHPSRLHRAMAWAVPIIRWVENRLYIRRIREQMRDQHFDTCVIYSDRMAETAVRAIRARRYLLFYHHGGMRRVWHDEIGYRKADKIVAVSAAVEQKLRAFRPRYAGKMTAIHNLTDVEGVREKGAAPVPEEFRADTFHIVSCGRMAPEKGMDLAVEACAMLVAGGRRNIHWWLIGSGAVEAKVRAKIAEHGLENHVTMLGMQGNPYRYISRADLYVQPSRFESYGLTISEAMVLGKRIVSTDTDGARVLIRDGTSGTLCPISAAGIAAAVAAVMDAPKGVCDHISRIEAQNQTILQQIEALL